MTFQWKNQRSLIWMRLLPTLLLLALTLCSIIWYGAYYSNQPAEFFRRWPFILWIATSFLFAVYFFVSLFRRRLQNANNYFCYLCIVLFVGLEMTLQIKPELTPGRLMPYLPKKTVEKIRIAIAHKWGYYTGENMIFHYVPSQQLNYGQLKRPCIFIDEEGFRNPNQNAKKYDFVLLGDSMIFGLDACKDLADRFKAIGNSAINLGMEGYAPQQYRDVYKKYIIEKNVQHKNVLVFLYIGNDFTDAEEYQRIQDENGDYTDYVIGETYGNPRLPLVLNLLKGLPHYLLQSWQAEFDDGDFPGNSTEDTEDMIDGRVIELPYTTFGVDDWLWPPPAINGDDAKWALVRTALDEIISLAVQSEATPWLFLLPSPLTVYSEFELNPPPNNSLHKFDRRHAAIRNLLEKYAKSKSVTFFDLDTPLKVEIANKFLFVAKNDGHFNDSGFDKVFEQITAVLGIR